MTTQAAETQTKEQKEFENNKKRLIALLGGDDILKKRPKGSKTEVQKAMEALVSEKKEAKIAEIKADASSLIEDYIAFQSFVEQKKKEFDKAVKEKQEEFNKKSQALFSKVDGIEEMERTYYEALSGAATPTQIDQED